MRGIIPIIVLTTSFLVPGYNSIKGNQEEGNMAITHKDSAASSVTPEQLTYATFLKKVWNFEKHPKGWIYEGDEPSVIDFYAVWCGPCKRLAPIIDEMAKKYDGKVKFYKVDVDKESKLASVFRIRSIPAVLFIPKHGKPRMQIGLLPHDTYVRIIDEQLLHKKPETRKQ
ncbi:MAG: thiol reductase thioredoxin [bacterium]|nr:MAG: thiol reductase thioredoxin [bacterium]